jgi:phosphate starvation-inducible PhoH-like protein
MVQPRSPNQRKYVEAIEQNDMTFGLGPAGTGKTYLAVAMAVSALMAKKVSRIILVRPAVEAGERLGFLPDRCRKRSTRICGRCTTRCTTCSIRRRWTSCWSRM